MRGFILLLFLIIIKLLEIIWSNSNSRKLLFCENFIKHLWQRQTRTHFLWMHSLQSPASQLLLYPLRYPQSLPSSTRFKSLNFNKSQTAAARMGNSVCMEANLDKNRRNFTTSIVEIWNFMKLWNFITSILLPPWEVPGHVLVSTKLLKFGDRVSHLGLNVIQRCRRGRHIQRVKTPLGICREIYTKQTKPHLLLANADFFFHFSPVIFHWMRWAVFFEVMSTQGVWYTCTPCRTVHTMPHCASFST